jgi:hypothetical protein
MRAIGIFRFVSTALGLLAIASFWSMPASALPSKERASHYSSKKAQKKKTRKMRATSYRNAATVRSGTGGSETR